MGLADEFDEVWCSRKCFDNFVSEHEGRDNLREENPLHAPYVRISKLLAGYRPPNLDRLRVLGGGSAPVAGVLERIGEARFGPLAFEAYEGAGGHVRGETVYLERTLGIAFTGDILVNLKGFTKPQAAFNRLAPYLMKICLEAVPEELTINENHKASCWCNVRDAALKEKEAAGNE